MTLRAQTQRLQVEQHIARLSHEPPSARSRAARPFAREGLGLRWRRVLLLPLILMACDGDRPLFRETSPLAPVTASGGAGGGADLGEPASLGPSPSHSAGASAAAGASGLGSLGSGIAVGAAGAVGDAGAEPGAAGTGGGNGESGAAGAPGAAGDSPGLPPVVTPDLPPPSDGSCGAQCVRSGGRCSEGTCNFDCLAAGSCTTDQILCPDGYPCEVHCGARSCRENVVCAEGQPCKVVCDGVASCASEVICQGVCSVTCSGARSCRGGIGGAVELLELECSGDQSCGSTVSCEGQTCRLSCSGAQSCAEIRAIAVENEVGCSGAGSCASHVGCRGNSCNVECARNACRNGVDCQALACDTSERDEYDD
jgi:hypothetical protein